MDKYLPLTSQTASVDLTTELYELITSEMAESLEELPAEIRQALTITIIALISQQLGLSTEERLASLKIVNTPTLELNETILGILSADQIINHFNIRHLAAKEDLTDRSIKNMSSAAKWNLGKHKESKMRESEGYRYFYTQAINLLPELTIERIDTLFNKYLPAALNSVDANGKIICREVTLQDLVTLTEDKINSTRYSGGIRQTEIVKNLLTIMKPIFVLKEELALSK